ncbi:SLAP domain-containing protein [Lactobacillus sp. ESL0679]|uniref:SLAP domain-containing protein n=1 Tax=Lactobacillus sp. ESL0679 TaxID=2983209 RepID=UPI0023F9E207|nr:SLAP domain-containing protein [Lactobacillus sp. ESL0679]MDF7682981.1 SLAP domain-containing protein [Lactobacillus sp. ESL0679]
MNKYKIVASLAGIVLLGSGANSVIPTNPISQVYQVKASQIKKYVLVKTKTAAKIYTKNGKKTRQRVRKGTYYQVTFATINKQHFYYLGKNRYIKKGTATVVDKKPQQIILTKNAKIYTTLGKNTGKKIKKGSKRNSYAILTLHHKKYYVLANGTCILKSTAHLVKPNKVSDTQPIQDTANTKPTVPTTSNAPTVSNSSTGNSVTTPINNETAANTPAIKPGTQEASIYSWLSQMQLKNGLIESAEDSNQVSLYDNALSAIVFTANGDYGKAEKIFDFFNSHLVTEFDGQYKGFAQFRDRNGVPTDNKPNRWLGDNAWLLIALNNYQAKTGSNKYEKLTNAMTTWIRSLQDTDGGLWGGTDQNNQRIGKNTEGILDAFIAVKGYDNFHQNILKYLKNNRFNPETGLLKTTNDNGKYMYALDMISWGFGMLQDYPKEALLKADMMYNTQTATASKNAVSGYSFDIDRDTIWIEGTGEMAVAFNIAGMQQKADNLISEMNKMFISSNKFKGAAGLPYATNPGTGYGTSNLWDGVDTHIAISSSAWYVLAKIHYNPYGYAGGRDKNIPAADRFYVK